MKHRVRCLFVVLGQFQGFSHLTQLDLGHYAQHVILALEIVEESSLAHIRGFRNVFYGYVGEASLCKELERRPEQPKPRLGSTALAPSHALQVGQILATERHHVCWSLNCLTDVHLAPKTIVKRQTCLNMNVGHL